VTTASAIIRALGGNLSTGMCQCPAHNDRHPSLHVSEASNGKPLVKCHAGCTQEDVIAELKRRGLWPTARNCQAKIHTHPEKEDETDSSWRVVRSILYRARKAGSGQPADYLHGRRINLMPPCAMTLPAQESRSLFGKNLPAMVCPIINRSGLPGAQVTWLTRDCKAKAGGSTPRQFYGAIKGGYIRLSKIDPDKPLIIGEGVETTLSAMQLASLPGIAALSATNMPAVKVPQCKGVIIAADNDEAGRKAATQLAENLGYGGQKVQIAFPPIEGTDWNDVLLQSGNPGADWQAALEAGDRQTDAGLITALDEAEFLGLTFPKRDVLLRPWLPQASLCMIHAQRGEGKTWFALSVGKALANGEDLLGWPCARRARVLYVDGELPGDFLQQRISQFPRSESGLFHVLCRDEFLRKKLAMPDLGDAEGRDELDRIIRQCQPDVVILDSISTLVRSGVENEAESWAPIQDWLMQHRWDGRTIILVHHEGKNKKPRGSSKREDVLDTMIRLAKKDDQFTGDESVFELTFTKARDFCGDDAAPMLIKLAVEDSQVTWTHEKARDARVETILEMHNAGMKAKDIAKEVGVTPGRVSQIIKELRDAGRLGVSKRDEKAGAGACD
jgi:putative DNA primase/helicase